MTIRVLVVDDQRIVRAGFRAMLDADDGITVVGEAADGHEAVALTGRLLPDVVLMDIRMPGMDGLTATDHIVGAAGEHGGPNGGSHPDGRAGAGDASGLGGGERQRQRRPRVLVLTTFDLDEYVYDALQAGASGFLLKDATEAELLNAVRVVARGDALLAPSVTRRLIADYARRPRPHRASASGAAIERLTPRETDVLTLVAEGMSNAEIASCLTVTEQTVKTHVSSVLTKLGLRDRVQVVVFAYESGMVTPQDAPPRRS